MIKNGTKADGLHAFTAESNTNKNVSINAHFRSLVPNTYNKIQIVIGENIFGWYDLPYSSSDFNWLSNCQDLHQFMHNNMNQTFSITIRLKKNNYEEKKNETYKVSFLIVISINNTNSCPEKTFINI